MYVAHATPPREVTQQQMQGQQIGQETSTSTVQQLARQALLVQPGDLALGKMLCSQIKKGLEPWMLEFRKTMLPLPVDNYSNARPTEAVITKMHLDIGDIDFDKQVFQGKVSYDYKNLQCDKVDTICMDVSKINIRQIEVNGTVLSPEQWSVRAVAAYKSDALEIQIPKDLAHGTVTIYYETSPDAQGLYWRNPSQTDGKEFPMLFTQAQAIDGPSFLPGQHSPQIRVPYSINIDTGNPNLLAIASSTDNPTAKNSDGKYSVDMPIAIPLYLLGIAVGNFDYHPYNERCGVYAEGCKLDTAAEKFQPLPEFITKAEEIFGDYSWKVYRPLLLPLAYPFGAMEHPCVSFLGGDCIDRLYVLAHELSHSWSGNWVTNGTWEEFFFNEGLTSYVEYCISSACISEDYAMMMASVNISNSREEIRDFIKRSEEPGKEGLIENAKLCGAFSGGNFEVSSVPYGKGELFFMMLEKAMGKDVFHAFLKDYMNVFALKSVCRERFEAFLKLWIEKKGIASSGEAFMAEHKFEEWMTGIEIPDNAPEIKSSLLDKIHAEADKVLAGEDLGEEINEFDGVMLKTLLSTLSESGAMTLEKLQKLDQKFHFTSSENYVLLAVWACLCSKLLFLTEQTSEMIVRFVTNRNSKYYTSTIAGALKDSAEGRKLLEKILTEGSEMLYPSIKAEIEKNLQSTAQ